LCLKEKGKAGKLHLDPEKTGGRDHTSLKPDQSAWKRMAVEYRSKQNLLFGGGWFSTLVVKKIFPGRTGTNQIFKGGEVPHRTDPFLKNQENKKETM